MTISKKAIVRAKLQGIMSTLQRIPADQKSGLVALEITQDFNGVLEQTAKEHPELINGLPKPFTTHNQMLKRAGKATASYFDLQLACDQVLHLMNLIED